MACATPTFESVWAWDDVVRLHRARWGDAWPSGTERVALVLAATGGVSRAAATVGQPRPIPFCSFGGDESLIEGMLRRLAGHVPKEGTHIILDRAHVDWASPLLVGQSEVNAVLQPPDLGSAVRILAPFLEVAVRNPEATVLVLPAGFGIVHEASLSAAIERAFRVAEDGEHVVVIGAEPHAPVGMHRWFVPFGARGGSRVVDVAGVATHPSPAVAADLAADGALIDTGFVAAKVSTLLSVFEELTPRLLRLFLFAAAMPVAEAATFLERAYEGLGDLDLTRDLVGFAPSVRAVVLPQSAGFTDLTDESRLAVWLAWQRSFEMMRPRRSPSYRRRLDPDGVV